MKIVRWTGKNWYLWGPTIAKMVLALLFFGSTDISNARSVSEAFLSNVNIKYNYFFLTTSWVGRRAEDAWGIPFSFIYRLFAILAEMGIGFILFRTMRIKLGEGLSQWLTILYLFNPVNIFISVFHGQLDSVVIFLILFAAILLQSNLRKVGSIAAGVAMAVAVGLKVFPLLFLPALLLIVLKESEKKLIFLITFMLAFLIPASAYIGQPWNMIKFYFLGPLSYRPPGMLGLSGIIQNPVFYQNNLRLVVILVIAITTWIRLKRNLEFPKVGLLTSVTLLAIGFLAPQYLVWLVPFVFLCQSISGLFFSWTLGFYLVWYYLFSGDNSGVFAALTQFSYLTPLWWIKNPYYLHLYHGLEAFYRWKFIGIFLLIWMAALGVKYLISRRKRRSYLSLPLELPHSWVWIVTGICIASTLLAGFLEYNAIKHPGVFDIWQIYGSPKAKEAHFLYGYDEKIQLTIPKELAVSQITIGGGTEVKYQVNGSPAQYKYGSQYWDYLGGFIRWPPKDIAVPLNQGIDNYLDVVVHTTSDRPEGFVNINGNGVPPSSNQFKVVPIERRCSEIWDGKPCSFHHSFISKWHISIVELLLIFNILYGIAAGWFILKTRKIWSLI